MVLKHCIFFDMLREIFYIQENQINGTTFTLHALDLDSRSPISANSTRKTIDHNNHVWLTILEIFQACELGHEKELVKPYTLSCYLIQGPFPSYFHLPQQNFLHSQWKWEITLQRHYQVLGKWQPTNDSKNA